MIEVQTLLGTVAKFRSPGSLGWRVCRPLQSRAADSKASAVVSSVHWQRRLTFAEACAGRSRNPVMSTAVSTADCMHVLQSTSQRSLSG